MLKKKLMQKNRQYLAFQPEQPAHPALSMADRIDLTRIADSVEIVLKNNRVAQMDCDCPYAADGNNCKHMAAVLFAADDTESTEYSLIECITKRDQEKQEARDSALTRAISELSEEQLRLLLTDAAKKHSDIWDRITLIGKNTVDPLVRKRWSADLHEITRRASDRHGFIDYRHASD